MEEKKAPLNVWAIVELMGHARIAGYCTERSVAGQNMLQVDVPETPMRPAFTRLFGGGAIYAITPVDEETCKLHCEAHVDSPLTSFDGQAVIRREVDKRLKQLAAPAGVPAREDEEEEEDEDDPY
jgi:hypothetical protein